MSIDMMLPLEAFDPTRVVMEYSKYSNYIQTNIQRFIYSLSYKEDFFTLSPISILTPFAKIHTWDFTTGKLELDIGNHSLFQTQFHSLQTSVRSLVDQRYTLKPYFHPMLFGTLLTVYVYTKADTFKERETWCCHNNQWTNILKETTFRKGDSIRLGIQFQGVSFLQDNSKRELKYRLQHQVKVIYKQLM